MRDRIAILRSLLREDGTCCIHIDDNELGDLICFGVLVGLAILFRRRSDVHKRLMLLATVGGLMPAALLHIIGHSPFLRGFHPAMRV